MLWNPFLIAGILTIALGFCIVPGWRGDTYYVQLRDNGEGFLLDDRNPRNGKPTLRFTIGGLLNPRRKPKLYNVHSTSWRVRKIDQLDFILLIEDVMGNRLNFTLEQALRITNRYSSIPEYLWLDFQMKLANARNLNADLGTLNYAVLASRSSGIARKLVRAGLEEIMAKNFGEEGKHHEQWQEQAPQLRDRLLAWLSEQSPQKNSPQVTGE